jgi:hypothetical protein
MKPTENIEKLLNNINVTPAPEKDRQMLNAILQAQAETEQQTPADVKPNIWRTNRRRNHHYCRFPFIDSL